MSNVYQGIYGILTDANLPTPLDNLVDDYISPSTQIVNIENDEVTVLPQIFFTKFTDTQTWNNPDRWQLWRIYFRDYEAVDSRAHRDKAYQMLNRGRGDVFGFKFGNIQCEDIGADPIKINNYWECYSDYRISYNVEE